MLVESTRCLKIYQIRNQNNTFLEYQLNKNSKDRAVKSTMLVNQPSLQIGDESAKNCSVRLGQIYFDSWCNVFQDLVIKVTFVRKPRLRRRKTLRVE